MPKRPLRAKIENVKGKGKYNLDEEIVSSDDDDDDKIASNDDNSDEETDDDELTAEQKRKKLAHEYLQSMQESSDGSSESEEEQEYTSSHAYSKLSDKLKKSRLESQGKYFRRLASSFENSTIESCPRLTLSGHDLSVTCVALTSDEEVAYSGSKDNAVIKWNTSTGQKQILKQKWSRANSKDTQSHQGEILAVAVTTDGKYVVAGGRDNMIRVFDSRTNTEIKSFAGHRDAVTSLSFKRDSYSLYSGSLDRCIKHWDLNEMGYLETLFGHQDGINTLDCWTKDYPLSGSSDRSVRAWKVSEESHLVFRGPKSNIDSVQFMTLETYCSAGQDGVISLWKQTQKKPVACAYTAHGRDSSNNVRWISSMCSIKMSDVLASGSNDGFVRVWDVTADNKRLQNIKEIPMNGFVNGIVVTDKLMVVGTGNEHRLGRWWKMGGSALNKVVIMRYDQQMLESSLNEDEGANDAKNRLVSFSKMDKVGNQINAEEDKESSASDSSGDNDSSESDAEKKEVIAAPRGKGKLAYNKTKSRR